MSKEAVIDFLSGLIKVDSDLADIMGAVKLRYQQASPDEPMPYIVMAVSLAVQDPWPIANGTVTFDVWDRNEDASRALQVIERLIDLLNQQKVGITVDERLAALRILLLQEPEPPALAFGVVHQSATFKLRLYKVKAAAAVLNRT